MSNQSGSVPQPWLRLSEVAFGLASVVVSVVVLANLDYQIGELVILVAMALLFSSFRMMVLGGFRRGVAMLEALGLIGGGAVTALALLVVILFPGLSFDTLVFLFAIALAVQGIGRLAHSAHREHHILLRGSALVTGALALALAVAAVLVTNIASLTLVPLIGVVVLLSGIEMIVSGLRPTDYRQIVLLKLILFSAVYGLVLINWVDLYGTSAPAYHVWLILTYMAPFGVLIVFQGLKDWQLAVSLGLLVSLMNDVGYFFVGDLLFGFHRALVPWIEGQLGFMGTQVLFYFQGGAFTIPVTSVLMGFTIYARIVVVSAVLYHWWKHPSAFDGPV
ncbi:MAG: DUF308 domain-containing protein [Nitrososphaerota archaeon]|nr:DUF308 domain-containing protein [Nitrososphaerota archaeon]